MDLSDLPQSARDRIAAAEIEADAILTSSRGTADAFAIQADRLGVDPSGIGFSPGDIPLELARKELIEGRNRAAGHIFATIAGEYLKDGKLDIPGFDVKLGEIDAWAVRKFQPNHGFLDEFKQHCRITALKLRAQKAEAKESTPQIPPNTDMNAWAERNRLAGEHLPKIATASGAKRQELICELAATLFASWARRRVNLVGSLDDIPLFDKEQGTYLSLIVLPHLSEVPLDDQDVAAIDLTIAGCRRTWLGRAVERTQRNDPERPASVSASAWSRAKALDSSFKTQLNQGITRDRVVCEHLQRCFDSLAEDCVDEGRALDNGTLHQAIPQIAHAVATKLGWLSPALDYHLVIVQEWMTKLLEGRIAYFEACKIGRPFGHKHEKPSFVYEAMPETDPLIQTVLLHEGLKKLNATEPFMVPEEVVRLGVEARGIPRGSPEFDTQFAIACVDLAKRHGGVCRVVPTIQPDAEAGRLEAVPGLKQARWEDIEFVIDDHTIEVHLAGKSETVGFEDFGFQDKRTGKPNQQWAVLQVLARCRGGVMPDDARQGTEWMAIAKRVERVRKTLQKRFGLHDDPMPFEEGRGYRARFKISRAPDPPEAHG